MISQLIALATNRVYAESYQSTIHYVRVHRVAMACWENGFIFPHKKYRNEQKQTAFFRNWQDSQTFACSTPRGQKSVGAKTRKMMNLQSNLLPNFHELCRRYLHALRLT